MSYPYSYFNGLIKSINEIPSNKIYYDTSSYVLSGILDISNTILFNFSYSNIHTFIAGAGGGGGGHSSSNINNATAKDC